MKALRNILFWVLLAALLTTGGFLLLTNLGENQIHNCDEARHGVNAYEMMQSGDYLVTTYRGETDYWNLKPPLSEYGIIAGWKLFGVNTFGMRFYSALSMLLTMLLVGVWTKKKYGSIASLACTGFFLACGMIYGHHFARFADADAQMVLFYTIAMLCMLQSAKNIRWLYGSAVCFGLAFMSKSAHAALIPLTCFLFVCVTGQIKTFRLRHYLALIFFGLLPIAPWAIARYQVDGLAFFAPMFTKDVVARATTVHEGHFGGWLYYVEYLLSDPAVCLSLAVILLSAVWRGVQRSKMAVEHWGLLLWGAVPVVFFTLCVSKLSWYVFVSLPAIAIGLGMGCQKLVDGLSRKSRFLVPRVLCVSLAFGLMGCWTWGNWQTVRQTENTVRYQQMINEYFDPDFDSGTLLYIQYESENSYGETDYRQFRADLVLCAQLAGDLVCMDGGSEAFVEAEEHAYLLCHEIGMNWDLLGEYPIVLQDGPLMLLENWY